MFFLPPAISAGFTVLEYIATDMLKDFDEWYEESKQLMLENAKFSGLTQVRNLLHMRRNTDFKDYRFMEEIPIEVINNLLKGEISTLNHLENEKFKTIEYNYLNNIYTTNCFLIYKWIKDDQRNDDVVLIDSINSRLMKNCSFIILIISLISCSEQYVLKRKLSNELQPKILLPYSLINNNMDSINIFLPISFNLENNSSHKINLERFSQKESSSINGFIINNKFYRTSDIKIYNIVFEKKSKNDITIYLKYKIPIKILNQDTKLEVKNKFENKKLDSIFINQNDVINKIVKDFQNNEYLEFTLNINKDEIFLFYCFSNNSTILVNDEDLSKIKINSICK